MNRGITLQGGRRSLRLPLSPVKAEKALKALEEWREPAPDSDRVQHWYRVQNAGAGPTQVNIFDEISWWGISAQQFIEEIALIDGDLEVHINSPGGDAFDGIAIYNALAARQGVTTVADGLVASAASVIFMAGQQRIAAPGSMVMIHDALALCIGNAADMRDTAVLLDKVSDNIASVYASHTSTPVADWRKAMVAEGWYTAQEAVDAGLAHKLAERPAGDAAAAEAALDRSVFARWQGQVTNAGVDESAWDGQAAMSAAANSDDPAAAYAAICAGRKAGDADKQSSWALPHHKHKGDPPNRAGVSAALGRFDQTQGLTNEAAARSHLESHQSAMGDGGQDDSADLSWLDQLDIEAFKEATK